MQHPVGNIQEHQLRVHTTQNLQGSCDQKKSFNQIVFFVKKLTRKSKNTSVISRCQFGKVRIIVLILSKGNLGLRAVNDLTKTTELGNANQDSNPVLLH